MANDFTDFILEDELDAIPSLCPECGQVHGMEACQYGDDEEQFFSLGEERALSAEADYWNEVSERKGR